MSIERQVETISFFISDPTVIPRGGGAGQCSGESSESSSGGRGDSARLFFECTVEPSCTFGVSATETNAP